MSGVNFQSLLSTPVGEAEAPKLLPAGDWPGVITLSEVGESSGKKTPFVRFLGTYTGTPEGMGEEELQGISAHGKKWRKEYYVNPEDKNSFYDLQQMLKSLGLSGGSYEELIPQAYGASVVLRVQQSLMSDRNGTPMVDEEGNPRMRNEIRTIVGA